MHGLAEVDGNRGLSCYPRTVPTTTFFAASANFHIMVKSELVEALAARFPNLVHDDAKDSVNHILHAIAETIGEGGRVEIRSFGSFSLVERAPRLRHNPKTRQQMLIAGVHVPRFKAGRELLRRVNATASHGDTSS